MHSNACGLRSEYAIRDGSNIFHMGIDSIQVDVSMVFVFNAFRCRPVISQFRLQMRVPRALRSHMYNGKRLDPNDFRSFILLEFSSPLRPFNVPMGASSLAGPGRPSSRGTSTTAVSSAFHWRHL
jgi:hypothetical protein